MNSDTKLEAEVIDEIHNGGKISAIKMLRKLRGIGLKEAKELVDLYISNNSNNNQVIRRSSSGGGILFLIIIGVVCYILYKYVIL